MNKNILFDCADTLLRFHAKIENVGRCGIKGHAFRGVEDLRAYLKELSVL